MHDRIKLCPSPPSHNGRFATRTHLRPRARRRCATAAPLNMTPSAANNGRRTMRRMLLGFGSTWSGFDLPVACMRAMRCGAVRQAALRCTVRISRGGTLLLRIGLRSGKDLFGGVQGGQSAGVDFDARGARSDAKRCEVVRSSAKRVCNYNSCTAQHLEPHECCEVVRILPTHAQTQVSLGPRNRNTSQGRWASGPQPRCRLLATQVRGGMPADHMPRAVWHGACKRGVLCDGHE